MWNQLTYRIDCPYIYGLQQEAGEILILHWDNICVDHEYLKLVVVSGDWMHLTKGH